MKKILIIHHWGEIGGAGLSLIHIIRAINSENYEVYIMCPEYPNEMIEALKKEKCIIIPMEKPPAIFNHYNGGIKHAFSPRTVSNVISILKNRKEIDRYIKNVSPDIVMVNSMTLFWIGKIAKKTDIKTVCFHRETYQKGLLGFRTNIIKYGMSKWFDKIAFISKFDLEATGKTKAKTQIIYDRVDFNSYNSYTTKVARRKLNLDQNGKYILFLGGASSLKGAEVIINAMKYVTDENVKLLFIGDVESAEELIANKQKWAINTLKSVLALNTKYNIYRLIKKNKLDHKIIFKKRSSHPELFYSACDLVVFPSTLAHQSRPIYEAGIAKIPMIITDFPETQEFAKDSISAITFRNKDHKELARKIEIVINELIDINKIIEKNYVQSIENHNLSSLKDDIIKILDFNY